MVRAPIAVTILPRLASRITLAQRTLSQKERMQKRPHRGIILTKGRRDYNP
jgi:hypothetical protein